MGVFQEYSETQILQMIGRAGRPQVVLQLLIYLQYFLITYLYTSHLFSYDFKKLHDEHSWR